VFSFTEEVCLAKAKNMCLTREIVTDFDTNLDIFAITTILLVERNLPLYDLEYSRTEKVVAVIAAFDEWNILDRVFTKYRDDIDLFDSFIFIGSFFVDSAIYLDFGARDSFVLVTKVIDLNLMCSVVSNGEVRGGSNRKYVCPIWDLVTFLDKINFLSPCLGGAEDF